MQNKPVLTGVAAAILIVIVAAASFSAGLYFGQRGYVADLQSQQQSGPGQFQPGGQFRPNQNGQDPQGGQNPQGNPPQSGPQTGQRAQNGPGPSGAPSWPPDVIGRITSISPTEIVLNTPNGDVTVAVNADTVYLDEQGAAVSADSLQVGFVIAVFGTPTATTVMHLPPPPNQQQQ